MNKSFLDLMISRKSAREFDSYIVQETEVNSIIEASSYSPSSKNSQPWLLRLLQGDNLEKIKKGLCKRFDLGVEPSPELNAVPLSKYRRRAVDLGKAILEYKGIAREDKEGRRLHDRLNFEFFKAPQVFLLGVDRDAYHQGTLIDCGIFLGYLLLAIEAAGFVSCPQMSPLIYPDAFYEILPEEYQTQFLCVIPFGKPLAESYINKFKTTREPLDIWFKKL